MTNDMPLSSNLMFTLVSVQDSLLTWGLTWESELGGQQGGPGRGCAAWFHLVDIAHLNGIQCLRNDNISCKEQ
jgi:hypothetical protein